MSARRWIAACTGLLAGMGSAACAPVRDSDGTTTNPIITPIVTRPVDDTVRGVSCWASSAGGISCVRVRP